jgi:subtilisin family serine protease
MMVEFNLKYGTTQLKLTQSQTLIGVRPVRNRDADATVAIRRALQGATWRDADVIGGFRILAIDDPAVDTDKALDQIRLDAAIAIGTHVFELPRQGGLYVPTGDLFVEFKSGIGDAQREAIIDRYKLAIKEARGANGFILSVTLHSPNPIKVAVALQEDSRVTIAEPDLASKATIKGFTIPMDGLLSEQWHLRNIGRHRGANTGFKKGADSRVIEAWSLSGTLGQPNTVVAVIDDGFDLDHPDFAIPGKVIHPWDFTRRSADPRPDPRTKDWHGTACAGVAVAATGGGGIVGAAPGCTLMPVRWGPDLSDAQIEAWFDYVTTKGAAVVSCSWGAANPYFPLSTRAHRAVERCARFGRGGKGCVVVFAAGNEDRDVNDPVRGSLDGFAIHPDVIAVAASTSRDQRSNYSNFGREISISAPSNGAGGWGILTSDVTGVDSLTGTPLGYDSGDYTYDFGGTSSACPLVAGIAALVLSVNPTLTSGEVKTLLQKTARRVGPSSSYGTNGHSRQFGYGCVNAAAAIRVALQGAQPAIGKRVGPRVNRATQRPARAKAQKKAG